MDVVKGLLIVEGRIPPFVATLSMLADTRGLTLVYTLGCPIAGLDKRFIYLAAASFSEYCSLAGDQGIGILSGCNCRLADQLQAALKNQDFS